MSYGKVHDAYWESERIQSVSDRAALLGLYLITGEHRNAIGCFKLGIGRITDDQRFKKWGIEGVSDALRELSAIGFIVRDDESGWTFIVNTFKHDHIKGAKSAVHALNLARAVPKKTKVYQELHARLSPILDDELSDLKKVDGYPLEAPSDGASNGHDMPKPSPLPSPLPSPPPAPNARAREPEAAAAPLEENPEKTAKAKAILTAFDAAIVAAFGPSLARPWPAATDLTIARRLVDEGCTAELAQGVFEAICQRRARKGEEPPKTLSYTENPVREAIKSAGKPRKNGKSEIGGVALSRRDQANEDMIRERHGSQPFHGAPGWWQKEFPDMAGVA